MDVSYSALDKVLEYMNNHPDVFVRLSGHTDDVGDEAYNLELSSRRAQSAAAYLVSQGILPGRITTAGFGETKPLVSGTTQLARDTNRRVEIEFFR
jgi:outer membrane protein OmpA-like peptidoglycan-associated protein